jgi:2,3-bisphosphoglycerate-independent phosphoglycerate mutase
MSALEVGNKLDAQIGNFDFIVVNFANADMVGHTGIKKAAEKACEAVDAQLGKIITKAMEEDYNVIVTADHGNAEKMVNDDGSPCTAHTTNPVPFILVSNEQHKLRNVTQPKLGNIAPTVLQLMGIPKPKEMTEESLCLT